MTRIYLVVGLVLLLLGGGFYAYHRHVVKELAAVQQQLMVANATLKNERLNSQVIREASNGYQNELQRLRDRPAVSGVPVRLCRQPTPGPMLVSITSPRLDATPSTGGGVPPPDAEGRDIGPDLFAIADSADECSAQVRGLQQFVVRLHEEYEGKTED